MIYRKPEIHEIDRSLFRGFTRRQVVTDCLRREGDKWVIKSDPFIDDWSEEDYAFLVTCLKTRSQAAALFTERLNKTCSKALFRLNRSLWRAAISTFPAFTFRRICAVRVSGKLFSERQPTGQKRTAQSGCISPPTPRRKVRRFIKRWAAWTPRYAIRSTPKPSRLTASLNIK